MVRSHAEGVRMVAGGNGDGIPERRICCKKCGGWLMTTRSTKNFTLRKRQKDDQGMFIYCRHCKIYWLLEEEKSKK